jgi:hypothetical protein
MTVDYGRRGGEATTPTWPTYLDEATDTDIISQTWVADGIYLDNTSPCQKWSWPGYYSNDVIAESYCTGDADPWSCCQQETDCDDSSFTNVSWGLGVAWFLNEFKQDMAAQTPTQVLGANRTRVVHDDCSPGWKHLDDTIANKPAYVLDESITINVWGAEASTEYSWWNESQWRNAIQTISTIDNSTVLFQGQTECTATTCREEPGGATTWTVYDQFWFHLASAALVNAPGIKPTIMVGWDDSGTGYNATEVYSEDWWPEYEELEDGQNLDFGAAESPCDWATCDGGSGYGIDECTAADTPYDFCTAENAGTGWFSYLGVYWREFENGYIIVNPTSSAVNGFALPDDVCVQFAHAASGDVIKYDASIPYGDCPLDADSTLNMPAYTGTFIRKTSPPAQVADDASFGGGAIIGGGASLGGS